MVFTVLYKCWIIGGNPIPNESYPVLYTGAVAKHVCTACVEKYKDGQV